ncbi:MAG: sigma-70 family RNA polymerase sigma factor [Deltaproteobacteria bacterium]|nr:MAG: sigma-70 family RNA polymerase sigma factor [Deltaproteobacteria bacterium]TMQ16555.1 MAG: sigma-70 family RNA polymerase sigma factor [Deltaproteobacteria bacterium]
MASPLPRHLYVVDGGEATAPVALTPDAAFRAHAGFVASVALRVLGRPSEVDDLVQDVFLRVLARLGDLREPAALRGWLAVITARLARRRLRTRSWRMWLGVDREYDYAQLADRGASPDDRALVGELYRALDRLPVRHRLAWTLRHVEGLELAQVARACDCSLATVKRWIAAADAALRMEVDHE